MSVEEKKIPGLTPEAESTQYPNKVAGSGEQRWLGRLRGLKKRKKLNFFPKNTWQKCQKMV